MLAVDKKGASYSIPLRSSYNCTVMAFRRYDGVIKKTQHETWSVDADLAEAMTPPVVQRSSGADYY